MPTKTIATPKRSVTGGIKAQGRHLGQASEAYWTPERRAKAREDGLRGRQRRNELLADQHVQARQAQADALMQATRAQADQWLQQPSPVLVDPPVPPPGPTIAGIVSTQTLPEEHAAAAAAYARYLTNPVAYVQEIILGKQPAVSIEPHQADLLDAVARYDRVAVKAANGMGKDTTTAWLIEWFLLTHPMAKVPCTSGVFRQVYSMLWSEVARWSKHSLAASHLRPLSTRVEVIGYEKEWFAEGFTAKEESEAEGYHAPHLLYCITEAKAVQDDIWRAVFKACTGEGNKIFAQSVPGSKLGQFHRIFTDLRATWKAFSYPAAVKTDLGAGEKWYATTRLVSQTSIDEKLSYGEDGPLFQAGVLANFISQSDDTVIPLDWVEQAQDRWRLRKERGDWGPFYGLGADIARSGADKNSTALRYGNDIKELRRFTGQDLMAITGQIARILTAHSGGTAVVDVVGLGAGVVDRLRELKKKVIAFHASEGTTLLDRSGEMGFLNLRAFAWWYMRELLDPAYNAEVALPPDEKLVGDLTTPRWKLTSSGLIQVESKEEIRKRLGRSTDDGDAVVMVFAGGAVKREVRIRWL